VGRKKERIAPGRGEGEPRVAAGAVVVVCGNLQRTAAAVAQFQHRIGQCSCGGHIAFKIEMVTLPGDQRNSKPVRISRCLNAARDEPANADAPRTLRGVTVVIGKRRNGRRGQFSDLGPVHAVERAHADLFAAFRGAADIRHVAQFGQRHRGPGSCCHGGTRHLQASPAIRAIAERIVRDQVAILVRHRQDQRSP